MELRRLTMVNWHLFDAEDVVLGGHVGILGENRSGKSTILDMIQVVLTGASKSYLRLNAVAGESGRTRSSKRSVHGYCLGALGEGEIKRDDARTYLALGFEDREGMRPPITIGLAMEARKTDASEAVYGRFVVVGRILTTADFIEEGREGRVPARWDVVRARITAQVGAGRFVNHHDSAIRYVREYMRHLVPASPDAEASAAAMHWSDINLDGTWIIRTAERATGRRLAPHLMSVDLAERYGAVPARAPRPRIAAAEGSAIEALANYLASPGGKCLEQEEIDPIMPRGNTPRSVMREQGLET